jgi:hypothetical protein
VAGSERLLVWSVDATAGFDGAWATISGRRLLAEGRAVGQRPRPYWVSYRLETTDDFVHRRLVAESRWPGGSARLDLRRTRGRWTVDGVPRADLAEALDCDLMACPLTNTMPVLRHDLLGTPADLTFLMAFVEIPGLRVVPSRQRYTHLRTTGDGAVVRYRSGRFRSDLTFDAEGFVVDYPQLGSRIRPTPPTGSGA